MPFQKGNQLGNRNGRPKGSRDFAVEMLEAIKTVEKDKGKRLLVFAVEKCFDSEKVLCSVLNKMVPDLSESLLKGELDLDLVVMTAKDAIEYHKRKLALYEAQNAVRDGRAEE